VALFLQPQLEDSGHLGFVFYNQYPHQSQCPIFALDSENFLNLVSNERFQVFFRIE
jgi:hypothetical protein